MGLVAVIFYCFIYPDGDMIVRMRKIFPIAGFAFLTAAFWSKAFTPRHFGYLFAAIVTTITSFYLLMRLFDIESFVTGTWYLSSFTYVFLAISLLMMAAGYAQYKADKLEDKIEQYNRRLEEIIKSSPFPIVISLSLIHISEPTRL